nr:hypothetical protein [Tanacetum cinerariifolium]
MAKSSSHNTSSPKITPKVELVTLDKPESPNPFLPATHVEFTFEEIAIMTNKKVHVDYAKLIWENLIHKLNKKTREKIVPYRRFISLLLKHMMPEYDMEKLTINPTQDMDEGTKNYSFIHIFTGANPSVLVDKTKYDRDGLKTSHTNLDKSKEEEAVKEDTYNTSHDMPKDTSVPPPLCLKSAQIQELMAQIQLLKSSKDELKQQKAIANVFSLKARPLYLDVNQLTTLLVCTMAENASEAMTKDVLSAGQATASPVEGEKNTKDVETNLKDELVYLLGTNVMIQYYNKKEDGSEEVISNLKVIDLHLAEWREVIQACLDKSKKGWKTIYDLDCKGGGVEGVWVAVAIKEQQEGDVASLVAKENDKGACKGASCTQRRVSMVPFIFSIPFVLSWGGSISLDSFLPSIMLLVVIVVMVVIVAVILIFVVVTIVVVVIVVTITGVVIVVTIIRVVVVGVLVMVAACASIAAATLLVISFLMAA